MSISNGLYGGMCFLKIQNIKRKIHFVKTQQFVKLNFEVIMKECDCKKQQTKVIPLLQKEMEKCGYVSQEAIEKFQKQQRCRVLKFMELSHSIPNFA